MFNRKIKSRQLEELLRKGEPSDLIEALKEVGKTPSDNNFKNSLRNKVMTKHAEKMKGLNTDSEYKSAKKTMWGDFRMKTTGTALATLLIALTLAMVSYPAWPAPEVKGYILKNTVREVSYNAPIKVVFSQMMDHASVEKAFSISPERTGKFEWNGSTLMFVPEKQFVIGENLEVKIGTGAKNIFQKNMQSEYLENFVVVKSPEVVLLTPNDGSEEVPLESKITVMFDRPLTELTTLEEASGKFPEFRIEPKVAGKMRWLGTSAFEFVPEKLELATEYKVTLPAGAESIDGGKTEKEAVAVFKTPRPVANFVSSNDEGLYYSGVKLKMNFSQKIDLNSLREKLKVYGFSGDFRAEFGEPGKFDFDKNGNFIDFDGKVYAALEKSADKFEVSDFELRYMTEGDFRDENKKSSIRMAEENPDIKEGAASNIEVETPAREELEKTVVISMRKELAADSLYVVKLENDLKPVVGNLNTTAGLNQTVITMGELKLLEQFYNRDRYFKPVFIFNNRLSLKSFKDKVTIDPKILDRDGKEIEMNLSLVENNNALFIDMPFKPSTKYKISLKAGGKDILESVSNESGEIEFETPALDANFDLKTTGDITILDSSTKMNFYAETVNAKSLNLSLAKLGEDEFNSMYQYGFVDYRNAEKLLIEPEYSISMPIEAKLNERKISSIDFEKLVGYKLEDGAYLMRIKSPEVTFIDDYTGIKKPKIINQLFIVTQTALTVKVSKNEMLVWATDMKTGNPVEGMNISTVQTSDEIAVSVSGVTDKNGLVKMKLKAAADENPYREFIVYGEKNGSRTIAQSSWSEGIAPWNFNLSYDPAAPEYYAYIYTDRPIYRPGHEVFFKGIIRKDNGSNLKLPDTKKVLVKINDGRGNMIYEKELNLSENGTFNDSIKLSENVSTGDFGINATLLNGSGPEWGRNFFSYFKVAEYRKPDYKLDLTPEKTAYINGEKAKIKVNAGYFFGAPLANGKLRWTLRSMDYFYYLPENLMEKISGAGYGTGWFSFSDEGYFCYFGCSGGNQVVSQGEAITDSQGNYVLEIPIKLAETVKMNQIQTLEVTVTDGNNQSISNRSSFTVYRGEFNIGVRSQDYVVNTEKPAQFEVVAVKSVTNELVSGLNVRTSLWERKWNTVKRKNLDGGYYFENNYDDKEIASQNVVTAANGLGKVEYKIEKAGEYIVKAESRDSKGNYVSSSVFVYASGGEYANWGQQNNDKMEIVADKQEYKPGDKAKLLIKSPYRGVKGLLTIERGSILSTELIDLKSNSQTVEIDIKESYLPNVFVNVVVMKGNSYDAGLVEPADGVDDERKVAAMKTGYVNLNISSLSKKLNLEIKSDKEKYAPGEEVELTINSSDFEGKAVAAEISVSVVDESVLTLTENITADLISVFYRQRWLGVSLAQTMTKALSRVNVEVETGLKGGGGGGQAKRGNFKDTAYFAAVVKTDSNGIGTVKFKLPDNLTTWQVLAIGVSDDTKKESVLVGSAKHSFVETKDILVRPVLPRFLTAGDKMQISAIVHNYTENDLNLKVVVDAKGVKIKNGNEKQIKVAKDSSEKVNFEIEVGNGLSDGENAVFVFEASNENNPGDVIENSLKVRQASFPTFVTTAAVIDNDVKHIEKIWLPKGLDLNYGKLTLNAGATFAGSLQDGLEYLIAFPYGCMEQISSAIIPNSAILKLVQTGKFKLPEKKLTELRKGIETGLQSIYKTQNYNGGFGLWIESRPNAYITAYTLYAMYQAKSAGIAVDQDKMNQAISFLKNSLLEINNKKNYGLNEKAFIQFVMSEMGQGDLGMINNIYEESKTEMNVSGNIYLAMALQNIADGGSSSAAVNEKIGALVKKIENAAVQTARGVQVEDKNLYYMYFDSSTRNTAMALMMLNRVNEKHVLIPKLVTTLLKEKKGQSFGTTNETSFALIALTEYLEKSGELEASYNFDLALNNENAYSGKFTSENLFETQSKEIALSLLNPENNDNEISAQRSGKGKLYFDLGLTYFLPLNLVKAEDNGMQISQNFYKIDDLKKENPIRSAKVTDNLKGVMTIVVPEDRYYVMVEDFLPAGLEGIDFNLKTSEQGLAMNSGDYADCYECDYFGGWYFNHSEVRDDRVMYFADFLPKGVYEIEYFVRATSVGEFADAPALVQETYFPEVFGRTAAGKFVIGN